MQLKISDMMDNLLPEEVAEVPQYSEPEMDTDRVKALVREQLPNEAAPRASRSGRKRRRSFQAAVAAVVLLLGTGTAFAAAHYFQWDDALREYLNPTAQQAEQLSPAGSIIGQKVTDNGVTVTLNQVLGDKYGVFIVLDVEGPADAVYDDSYSFSENFLRITNQDGESFGMGYGYTAIADSERPNHFSLIFDINASQSLVGTQAQLNLADLRQYSVEAMDYLPVTEGNWTFEWTLDYTDLSKTREIDAPFALYGDKDRLDSVILSPLSLSFTAHGPGFAAFDQAPDFDLPSPDTYLLDQLALVMADGTEQPVPFYSSGASNEGDSATITYTFGEVLSMEEITAIRIGEEIYPLK